MKKIGFIALIMTFVAAHACAQDGVVELRGRITAGGQGVPYATLLLRGTSIGVQCNDAGYYELRLPQGHEADSVEVRSMGYTPRTVAVNQLQRRPNVVLRQQAVQLETVTVSDFIDAAHLLREAVRRIGRNYTAHDSYATFFFRNWRAVDGELYLFDEAVIGMQRAPYTRYAKKQAYLLDPTRREMATNYKHLLRHRLIVLDSALLRHKTNSAYGVLQKLEWADNEIFFDPVATPEATFCLSTALLRQHRFEPISQFDDGGEEYYMVRSVGPNRLGQHNTRYCYIIRRRDLAIVSITSAQMPINRRAPGEEWVRYALTRQTLDTDSSAWQYSVRQGRYTLTHYHNSKRSTLHPSHHSTLQAPSQQWQECTEWVLTDFAHETPATATDTIAVMPQTLTHAFGQSDYSASFWGHYNAITLDTLPARLLYEKLLHNTHPQAIAPPAAGNAAWQADGPADCIEVAGTVVSKASGDPEPFCKVLLRRADTVAHTALTDIDGNFVLGRIEPGNYSLEVSVMGRNLTKRAIALNESARLRIALDTVRTVYLTGVTITGKRHVIALPRHLLSHLDLEITSPDDIHLWDFNYRPWMALWGIRPRNASASNAGD